MPLGQPPRQRQPEAGAFAAAREPGIHLTEGLDRDANLSRGHAQAGIPDFEFDAAIVGAVPRQHHAPARLGEFDRVAEQVQQNLFQPGPVCDEGRQTGLELGSQHDPCRRGTFADQCHAAVGESARIETAFLVQFQLAGVDFGEVKDLVDDVQQMRTALADVADIFPLPGVERSGGAGSSISEKPRIALSGVRSS